MLAEPGQGGRDLGDAGEPEGGDVAEGHRRGVLAEGAAGAGRPAVARREPDQPGEDRVEVGGDQVEGLRHLQHERRVDDVLRGGGEMEVAAELLRQPRLDRLGEGDDRDARHRDLAAERREVEVLGRDLLDRRGEAPADDPGLGLGPRQLGLGAEHRRDPRPVGEHRPHRIGGEERAEQRGVDGREGHGVGLRLERQPDVVLRERGHRRARGGDIVEFGDLSPAVEGRVAGMEMEHGRHPPGEALRLPYPFQAARRIAGEQRPVAAPVPGGERLGQGADVGDGEVHALGPGRRHDMGGVAGEIEPAMLHRLGDEAPHRR